MASRASNRSSRSAWWAASRPLRGMWPIRPSTGSTPTSIRRWTIHGGARRVSGGWANSANGRPSCSTATATRWAACTTGWISKRITSMLKKRWTKVLVFSAGLAPIFWLCWRAWNQNLTANPIEYITHYTGDWTIRFIVFTLAVTPLRKLLGLSDLIRFRRMIGLYAFFYGTLHFITYIWLDKFFDLAEMLKDVEKRRFITAGFTAFLSMAPLALTSTAGWIRRMGGKRWQRLHRLIYVSGIAGVVHYYWLVKSDIRLPAMYGAIVGVLLLYRVAVWARKRNPGPAVQRPVAISRGGLRDNP